MGCSQLAYPTFKQEVVWLFTPMGKSASIPGGVVPDVMSIIISTMVLAVFIFTFGTTVVGRAQSLSHGFEKRHEW